MNGRQGTPGQPPTAAAAAAATTTTTTSVLRMVVSDRGTALTHGEAAGGALTTTACGVGSAAAALFCAWALAHALNADPLPRLAGHIALGDVVSMALACAVAESCARAMDTHHPGKYAVSLVPLAPLVAGTVCTLLDMPYAAVAIVIGHQIVLWVQQLRVRDLQRALLVYHAAFVLVCGALWAVSSVPGTADVGHFAHCSHPTAACPPATRVAVGVATPALRRCAVMWASAPPYLIAALVRSRALPTTVVRAPPHRDLLLALALPLHAVFRLGASLLLAVWLARLALTAADDMLTSASAGDTVATASAAVALLASVAMTVCNVIHWMRASLRIAPFTCRSRVNHGPEPLARGERIVPRV